MKRFYLLLAMLGLLAGCQLNAPREQLDGAGSPAVWRQHQQQSGLLQAWELSGKLGVRSDAQNASATLFWLQRNDYYDIRVSGPLGQGSARLQGERGLTRLTHGGQQLDADSPEQLMRQQLGWSLPVSSLYWWVRGLPAPGSSYQLTLNNDSHASRLRQDGWQLDYSDYQRHEQLSLPGRIRLSGPHLQATLLIKQWQPRNLLEPQP